MDKTKNVLIIKHVLLFQHQQKHEFKKMFFLSFVFFLILLSYFSYFLSFVRSFFFFLWSQFDKENEGKLFFFFFQANEAPIRQAINKLSFFDLLRSYYVLLLICSIQTENRSTISCDHFLHKKERFFL